MMDLQHLPNARPGERVEIFLRRHWTTPLEIVVYSALLYIVPAIGFILFSDQISEWLTTPFVGHIFVLAVSSYVLIVWLFAFLEFSDYYLDIWIVTTERIINIEQKGLFTRVASELHLSSVEDTTSEVKGILHTFLNYGNVFVQTAGERTRFIFKGVPDPEKIKEKIVKLTEDYKNKQAQK